MPRLFALLVFLTAFNALATPIKWRVNALETASKTFTAYHGETLEFCPEFVVGSSVITRLTYSLYWQTNGMGQVWWSAPGTTFAPSNDVGASSYRFFIRALSPASEVVYRANGTLRMLPSPGFVPAEIDLPVKTIDFAAVETLNAPWATPGDVAQAVQAVDVSGQLAPLAAYATNTHDYAVAASNHLQSAIDTKAAQSEVDGISSRVSDTMDGLGAVSRTLDDKADKSDLVTEIAAATNALYAIVDDDQGRTAREAYALGQNLEDNKQDKLPYGEIYDTIYAYQIMAQRAMYDESWNKIANHYATKAQVDSALTTKAEQSDVSDLSSTVAGWTAIWGGNDARLTVTNYYGAEDLPHLYLEQKMPAGTEGHTNEWFKVIWDEMTRWNAFLTGEYADFKASTTNNAARAFGRFNSLTGRPSPDGVLQISQPVVQFTDGSVTWERASVEVGGCTMWTVMTNGLRFDTSATTNDFFRIFDGTGKTLFEVVQGDKRTIGATATGTSFDGDTFVVTYNTNVKPDINVCTNLVNPTWYSATNAPFVAALEYDAAGNDHVFAITPQAGLKSMFVSGTYEAGGDTYIRNNAPVAMSSVVIGGVQYSISVAEINGKKLMVLTED